MAQGHSGARASCQEAGPLPCPRLCPGQKADTLAAVFTVVPLFPAAMAQGHSGASEFLSAETPGDTVPSCQAVKSTPFLP
ncbi:hypothetical protein PAL_GLEAN10012133 [Pteropus alecto]|uniref:Uncharacterized protein n=1 Tax=Pteropus alecto TaxID=9402 RepID=L5KDQ7_PTEAL|nr:hypothetical protein PAL_GLEAN10012133 [Pteropus alecto]